MKTVELKEKMISGGFKKELSYIYACSEEETERYAKRFAEVMDGFEATFGAAEEHRPSARLCACRKP